jgi:cell wall-associated NlpC family hydrolase
MSSEQANSYIGLPWADGARGPESFDCWGLLRWVQLHHFSIALPDLPSMPDMRRDLYREQMASGAWNVIARPAHGCGVLLRSGDRPHVGVYLDLDGGGVLHAQEGAGVIYTERSKLKKVGYPRASWYSFL